MCSFNQSPNLHQILSSTYCNHFLQALIALITYHYIFQVYFHIMYCRLHSAWMITLFWSNVVCFHFHLNIGDFTLETSLQFEHNWTSSNIMMKQSTLVFLLSMLALSFSYGHELTSVSIKGWIQCKRYFGALQLRTSLHNNVMPISISNVGF